MVNTALKRPKGWRKGAGHRTSWIDARRAAEEYWAKWLEQAALRADVMQLASRSLAKERKARPRKQAESSMTSPMLGHANPHFPGLWPGSLTAFTRRL